MEDDRERAVREAVEDEQRRGRLHDALRDLCCAATPDPLPTERPADLPPQAVWPPRIRPRTPSRRLIRLRLLALDTLARCCPTALLHARDQTRTPKAWASAYQLVDLNGSPSPWAVAAVILDRDAVSSHDGTAPLPVSWLLPFQYGDDERAELARTGVLRLDRIERGPFWLEIRSELDAFRVLIEPSPARHVGIEEQSVPSDLPPPDARLAEVLGSGAYGREWQRHQQHSDDIAAWYGAPPWTPLLSRTADAKLDDFLWSWADAVTQAAGHEPAARPAGLSVVTPEQDARRVRRVAEILSLRPPQRPPGRAPGRPRTRKR